MEKLHDDLRQLNNRWQQIASRLDLDNKRIKIRELEAASLKQDFWNDSQSAGHIMSELSALQKEIQDVEGISSSIQSAAEMVDLSKEDQSLASDLEQEVRDLQSRVEKFETLMFLSGKFDAGGVILSIHAGQGDRKSTRLNSSHGYISYAVFC